MGKEKAMYEDYAQQLYDYIIENYLSLILVHALFCGERDEVLVCGDYV